MMRVVFVFFFCFFVFDYPVNVIVFVSRGGTLYFETNFNIDFVL